MKLRVLCINFHVQYSYRSIAFGMLERMRNISIGFLQLKVGAGN